MTEHQSRRVMHVDEAVEVPTEPSPAVQQATGPILSSPHVPRWFPLEPPAPEMVTTPEDALGVWTWFLGDVLSDDPEFSAWDFYSPASFDAGRLYGGEASAAAEASQEDLLEQARTILGRRDLRMTARTWQLRATSGPYRDQWVVVPAFVVTSQEETPAKGEGV